MVSMNTEKIDPRLLELGFAEFVFVMVQPVIQTDVAEQNERITRPDGRLPEIIEQFVRVAVYISE